MDLTDIGSNLASPRFADDLPDVLARAHQAGVTTQLITGSSVASSTQALALAEKHAGLYATAGIHPHESGTFDNTSIAALKALAAHPRVRAIGETGLDFYRDLAPRDQQERAFSAQLGLAVTLGKPAFLHVREAHARFLPLLKAQRDGLVRVVVHCFTGTRDELFAYLDLDCYIGITGWACDPKRGAELRPLIASIPDDRLLVETDAPYLLPRGTGFVPVVKGRNEPCFLPQVVTTLAQCRATDRATLARLTTANARRFMGLDI